MRRVKMKREEVFESPVEQFGLHMEDKEKAEASIRNAIPAYFLQKFRFDTLQLHPLSLENKLPEGIQAGYVYECQDLWGKSMYFALLLDAGEEKDRQAHLEVMQVTITVLENLDEGEGQMARVIPILFWPGAEKQGYKPWESMFEGGGIPPELKLMMPNADYVPGNFVLSDA